MKISLGELRQIIRESIDDELTAEGRMFYSILNNLADRNGGYLQVTHETPAENIMKMRREGIKQQPGSHGIYFTVGWYDEPRFVTGPGAMFRVEIPKIFLNPTHVVPDDRFSSDNGYAEFLEEFPDGVGGEIGTDFDWILPEQSHSFDKPSTLQVVEF